MSDAVRPISVKVGHSHYDIKWVSEKRWLKKHDADKAGFFWVDDNSIQIRLHNQGDDRHEDSMRETLLHEILHACWHHTNMSGRGKVDQDELEEWVVGTISFPFMQVMADNPDVVEYLWPGTVVPEAN